MLPDLPPDTTTLATQKQVLQALASLAGLPSRLADDVVLDQAMYFVALEGVTRYALSEAIKGVMRNRLGHTFFPSPIELRRLCDEAQQPFIERSARMKAAEDQRRERAALAASHAAKTPEVRRRVAAVYERFCAGYSSDPDLSRPSLDPARLAHAPDAPLTFERVAIPDDMVKRP